MVQALKVGEQMVPKPLKRLLIRVFQNIIFPNKAVLRVVERVKLVKQKALAAVWRLYEVNYDVKLSYYWI